MKKIPYITAVIVLALSTQIFALGIAKYAGEFMSTGVGARSLGMGGAHVAIGGDVTFGYWNPAGLTTINYPELTAMHSRRFGGVVNYDYAGFAMPFRKSETLALNIIRLAVDDIPIPVLQKENLEMSEYNRPVVDRYVSDAEYALFLSYATKKSDKLSLGANVKFVHKGAGDNSAWGVGFDIGALWNPVDKLLAGVNFQDVTTTILAWDTGTKELISPTLKAGLAYPVTINLLASQLWLAVDGDIRFENRKFASQANIGAVSFDPRLGLELTVRRVVALRLGRDDLGCLAAGAGIKLPRLDLDYAFLSHDQLESTHRISFRLRLEEQKFLRK
ncbi:MAG TPA: PorV/PorQ family protein [bacterium]|nr:PorV/PorQ family protein [bacterium]HPN43103.1 PorV/PorQ family protein [bacterium]